jgi:hypothetical protein
MVTLKVEDFWDPKKDFWQALMWLKEQHGGFINSFAKDEVISGHGWRSYRTEESVEGFYESTYWLEFDNDADSTAFLLRWA